MDMLAVLVEKFKECKASEEFDKEGLLEAHEKSFKEMRQMESMRGCNTMGFTIRKPSEHWRPSVPLKGLRPIRARELQIDKHHKGSVVIGTLCADPLRMVAIMTILEDQYGDAVRLAICNTSTNQSASSLYPKVSKVAIKQPYFKQGSQDDALMLRVDNPQNVEILASFPGHWLRVCLNCAIKATNASEMRIGTRR
ncbi:hypothetical protein SUGI_0406720 [Cryptomeria japonica]|uniref:uncharacterized protein LOC131875176 n=1 Tax=Cryptomeria japonica TaxID=3369 RepID=UPI002408C123|nr:uncharacterized protein LOC131875176 [Cryptomeria japonica]GLJ21787.1 hypothetical protein SUGI_0406720 [Cryptomeria japonica]